MIKIDFHSNRTKIIEAMRKQVETAMQKIGEVAADETSQAIDGKGMRRAVLTGRMKNSIQYATQNHSGFSYTYSDDSGKIYSYKMPKVADAEPVVYVGTEVYYAEFVHFGMGYHVQFGAREFLRLGFFAEINSYKNIVQTELKN